jgi:hypothetical protein
MSCRASRVTHHILGNEDAYAGFSAEAALNREIDFTEKVFVRCNMTEKMFVFGDDDVSAV